jgi:hypothetical protein
LFEGSPDPPPKNHPPTLWAIPFAAICNSFLVERIGSLPDSLQEEVDEGLRTILYH